MKRIISLVAGVFFLVGVIPAFAQNQAADSTQAIPAANRSEIECSGYISASEVPNNLYINGGADNDFRDYLHGWAPGDYVFLHIHIGSGPTVGSEYRIVRPASEKALKSWARSGLGPMPAFGAQTQYFGQNWDIHKLGRPYADVGRVKIVKLTEEGVVAQVTFACGPLHIGDLALPYQPRPIPTYTPTEHLDRFALTNGKKVGAITAVKNNFNSAGIGGIVYINLGQKDSVQPGQKFRIVRQPLAKVDAIFAPPILPDETVGELIVLSTQEKSSVGIVVTALRDIDAGDAIQQQ